MSKFIKSLTRLKPVELSLSQNVSIPSLTVVDLIAYGIAASVGSGIHGALGTVHAAAGPAAILSTIFASILALLTAFSYLEFASAIPVSGSGYVYAYTCLGELVGMFMGWNLTLEYSFSAAVIAATWTDGFMDLFNLKDEAWYQITLVDNVFRINFLAGILVILVGLMVLRGTKASAVFNNFITGLNLLSLILIIIFGCFYVETDRVFSNFMPNGITGVIKGTPLMFFSYIGFDTICTLSADAKNPKRDVPIAVLSVIGIATFLYTTVSFIATGMAPEIDDKNFSLANVFLENGLKVGFYLITAYALSAMAATLFACLVGQPKIFMSMADDGLLPESFSRKSKKDVAYNSLAFTIFITAIVASLVEVERLLEFITFGCLFGFALVSASVMILRFRKLESLKRIGPILVAILIVGNFLVWTLCFQNIVGFKVTVGLAVLFILCPFLVICVLFIIYRKELNVRTSSMMCPLVPLLPSLSITGNIYVIMTDINVYGFLLFIGWTLLGFAIYFLYGRTHSILGRKDNDKEMMHTK